MDATLSLQGCRRRLGPRHWNWPRRLLDRLRIIRIIALRRRVSRRLRLARLLYLILSPSTTVGGH